MLTFFTAADRHESFFKLNFFSVANQRYEPFVIPYILGALHHNPDASVEIALEKPRRFEKENDKALNIIRSEYGGRFKLRDGQFGVHNPNSMRFTLEPQTKSEYVYIGDIDILILEEVAPPHLDWMARTGLPYSNIRRNGKDRLTGLHFTRYEAFYPLPDMTGMTTHADETLLFEIVAKKNVGLPEEGEKFRPLHGYHMTLSRPPISSAAWGGIKDASMLKAYSALRKSGVWRELFPLFDRRYRIMLSIIEAALYAHHNLSDDDMKVISPKDWWDN